jgi:hypothetical protein
MPSTNPRNNEPPKQRSVFSGGVAKAVVEQKPKSGSAKDAEPALPWTEDALDAHCCANTGVVVPGTDIANPAAKTADNIIAAIRLFLFIFVRFTIKII